MKLGLSATAFLELGYRRIGLAHPHQRQSQVDARACAAFYGDKPAGYLVYTRSGFFLSQTYATKRVVPKTPDPTDEERIALHKSMFALGGTYKVDGNKVTVAVEFAWNESWKGTVRPGGTFKVDGETLTVESSPFKWTVDGTMVVTKLMLERVE